MNFSQLIRTIKQGKQGLKVLRATDLAIDSTVYFEVSDIPFMDRVQAQIDKLDDATKAAFEFLKSFIKAAVLPKTKSLDDSCQDTLNALNYADKLNRIVTPNKILFIHYSRDNTAQIDSFTTAQ